MKRMFVALGLVALVSSRLNAELKYTMHMEMKKGDPAAAQGTNPMLAMMVVPGSGGPRHAVTRARAAQSSREPSVRPLLSPAERLHAERLAVGKPWSTS